MRTLSPSVEDIISDEQLPGDKQSGQAQLGRAVEAITYLQRTRTFLDLDKKNVFKRSKEHFGGTELTGVHFWTQELRR